MTFGLVKKIATTLWAFAREFDAMLDVARTGKPAKLPHK
ncbi:hypothetical protein EL18_00801 [Nitratireductor basaltis]|uniref:Uncharacterized protein n=1 Tax=Nitratireductor basaltis TaxID=472175 RepID=A0A084U9Z6_9HYPH|nr:hypothetical protein EL18_00801 [Nitratireductor basaltis]